MAFSSRTILLFILFVMSVLRSAAAFAPIHQGLSSQSSRYETSFSQRSTSPILPVVLHSTPRKKRRRRKDDGSLTNENDDDFDDASNGSDLPDFDLNESSPAAARSSGSPGSATGTKGGYVDPLGEISANMMGSASRPGGARSVQDLLRDRSLERKLEFMDSSDGESLPDLLPLKIVGSGDQGPTKRERQAARRLELQSGAATNEKEEESLLMMASKLPLIRDEKGNVSGVKILENATWVCIWALIAWEVYLNSPFFDRAAPMTPVVY